MDERTDGFAIALNDTTREWGESSRGRIVPDANHLSVDESTIGRIVQRLGETSMGRKVQWAKRRETVNNADSLYTRFIFTHVVGM